MSDALIRLLSDASTPEEAIRQSGDLLMQAGVVKDSYVDAMLQSYGENGAYFVIALQIAVPHARPEDGANYSAVSFVSLAEPIPFGSKENDPVKLIFGLAAGSGDDHLRSIQRIVNLLSQPGITQKLADAKTKEEIHQLVGEG